MPSESLREHDLMEMVAHDPKAAKRVGIPQSVGREFVKADKKAGKFADGGEIGFHVHSEEPNHFVAGDRQGRNFRIAKEGLRPERVAEFRAMCKGGPAKMADGGEVKPKGMDLSRVKLVKETDTHWHLDDGQPFAVPKKGVSAAMRDRIAQHFDAGGDVQPDPTAVQSVDPNVAGASQAVPTDPAGLPATQPAPDTDVSQGVFSSGSPDAAGMFSSGNAGDIRNATGADWNLGGGGAPPPGWAPMAPVPGDTASTGNLNAAAPPTDADATPSGPQSTMAEGQTAAPAEAPAAAVQPTQQPTAAMPQAAPAIPSLPGVGGGGTATVVRKLDQAEAQGKLAAQAQADVATRAADARAAVEDKIEQQRQALSSQWQQTWKNWQQRGDELRQAILDQKIDPNHYWNSKSTAGKISAAIGLILGGIGGGLSHQPNAALGVINSAIDRDLDAQKANLGKKTTLLGYHLQQGQTLQNSYQLARADMLDSAAAQLQHVATKYAGQQAQADAQGKIAALTQQSAVIRQQVAAQGMDMALKGLQAAKERALFPLELENTILQRNMQRLQYGALSQFMGGQSGAGQPGQPGQAGSAAGGGVRMPAQAINFLPKEMQEKIVALPDGTYAMARSPKDAEEVTKSTEGAAVLRAKLQRYNALLAQHPNGISSTLYPGDYASANALRESMLTDINSLAGLNRFTDAEAKLYSGRIPDITSKGRAATFAAPLHELGREIDESIWLKNRTRLNLPNRRLPGAQ